MLDHKWTFVMQSDTVLKKMSQIFYFLMIRDRRKLMTLLELHGEFVVGFFVPNCALFNRKILGKYLVGPFSISICHAFSGSCMHVTVFSTFWIWTKSLFLEYLLLVPMYSKASWYTASRCTELDNAHFWIGSKKIWDAQIYVVKTVICTVFWCFWLCLIK